MGTILVGFAENGGGMHKMRLIDADVLFENVENIAWYSKAKTGVLVEGATSEMDSYLPTKEVWNAIKTAPTIDAVPVVHARWEWFEEWSPSTTEHLAECENYGWRCGRCKTALEDMVGGYWDDSSKEPELNFCPNCGAKMDRWRNHEIQKETCHR